MADAGLMGRLRSLGGRLNPFSESRDSVLERIAHDTRHGEPPAEKVIDEAYQDSPPVYAAVQRIATAAQNIPLRAHEDRGEGETEPVPDHEVQGLLDEPNEWHPPSYLTEHFVSSLALTGDAFALLNGPTDPADATRADPGREPTEIIPLSPARVEVEVRDDFQAIDHYKVKEKHGKKTKYPPSRIVHPFLWDPERVLEGMGPSQPLARTIDLNTEGRRWNANLMRNLARPPGGLSTDHSLTEQQYNRLQEEIERKYSGQSNAGRPLLLEEGMEWEDFGLSPKDMDWIEGQREMRRDIAVAMNIAPELLGDPETKTYANAQHARWALYEDAAIPLMKLVAHGLQVKLRQWWEDVIVKPDPSQAPAMQQRRLEQAETLTKLVKQGVLTRNEARQELGYEEVDGGDELLGPMNVMPIADADAEEAGVPPPTEEEIRLETPPGEAGTNGQA